MQFIRSQTAAHIPSFHTSSKLPGCGPRYFQRQTSSTGVTHELYTLFGHLFPSIPPRCHGSIGSIYPIVLY